MTLNAHGSNKITTIKLQSGRGVAASGSGGQVLRADMDGGGTVFSMDISTYEANERSSHKQSTGARGGERKFAGKINGLLSCGTYSKLFASLLRKDFVATSPYAAGIDVTAQAADPQFVDASAGFLTAGLKVGDVGRWTGFAGSPGSGNNARNFLIDALTAGNMSGNFLDGDPALADTAGDSVTFTLPGKKTLAPLTAHTDDWWTIEEWYPDISRSELFVDCRISAAALTLPTTGNAKVVFDVVALSRTLGAAQVLTTPTAATTTAVLTAAQGMLARDGVEIADVTSLQFGVSGTVAPDGPAIGSRDSADSSRDIIKVSGTFTAFFRDAALSTLVDNETVMSLIALMTADDTGTSDAMVFTMGRVKLFSDTPDDGNKAILRSYNFTAELNSAGGAALAWDQTILTIQDTQAA